MLGISNYHLKKVLRNVLNRIIFIFTKQYENLFQNSYKIRTKKNYNLEKNNFYELF